MRQLFTYCTIIALVAICNNAARADAKPAKGDLMGQEPPQDVPQEPPHGISGIRTRRETDEKDVPQQTDENDVPQGMHHQLRSRRHVPLQQGDEPDMPEEPPHGISGIRTRRETDEKDVPQQTDENDVPPGMHHQLRTKRQMPSLPDGMPEPPPPPMPQFLSQL